MHLADLVVHRATKVILINLQVTRPFHKIFLNLGDRERFIGNGAVRITKVSGGHDVIVIQQ